MGKDNEIMDNQDRTWVLGLYISFYDGCGKKITRVLYSHRL